MTKQEKIREGIDNILDDWTDLPKIKIATLRNVLLTYLYGKGVVIKVDREWCEDTDHFCIAVEPIIEVKCPDCTWSQFRGVVGMTPCYRCNSTGYITEPIIEEEK